MVPVVYLYLLIKSYTFLFKKLRRPNISGMLLNVCFSVPKKNTSLVGGHLMPDLVNGLLGTIQEQI